MEPNDMDALLGLMKQHGVAEFTYSRSGETTSLAVKFAGAAPVVVAAAPVAAPAPAAAARPAAAAVDNSRVIRAPIVGTFYRSPAPDKPAYVEVGDRVRKGQVVCIVEAMKLMNQIESDVDGVIAEILVDNATPVQFGQELFRLAPG